MSKFSSGILTCVAAMVLSLTGSVRELALRLVRMGDSHGLVFWTFIHIRPDGTVRTNIRLVWRMLLLTNFLVYAGALQLRQHSLTDLVDDTQAISPCISDGRGADQ